MHPGLLAPPGGGAGSPCSDTGRALFLTLGLVAKWFFMLRPREALEALALVPCLETVSLRPCVLGSGGGGGGVGVLVGPLVCLFPGRPCLQPCSPPIFTSEALCLEASMTSTHLLNKCRQSLFCGSNQVKSSSRQGLSPPRSPPSTHQTPGVSFILLRRSSEQRIQC